MRQSFIRAWWWILAGPIALVFLAGSCPLAVADEVLLFKQPAVRVPQPGGVTQGFTATIEVAEHDIAGYVPVEITITATARFTTDRRFVFHFASLPDGRTPPRNSIESDVPIFIDQGTKTKSVVRYLPKWSAGCGYVVNVSEDGRLLPDYLGYIGSSVYQGRRPKANLLNREYDVDWMHITANDRERATALQPLSMEGLPADEDTADAQMLFGQRLSMVNGPVRAPLVLTLGQKELPDDWRGYQRYDVALVGQESLQRLQQEPLAFNAFRQWVLNGGIVLGYDASSTQSLCEQLQFAWTDDQDARGFIVALASNLLAEQGKEEQEIRDQLKEMRSYLKLFDDARTSPSGVLGPDQGGPGPAMGMGMGMGIGMGMDEESAKEEVKAYESLLAALNRRPRFTATQWGQKIGRQSVGGGLVIAFKRDDTGISEIHWQIAETLISFRRSPMLRRGVDPLIGDRRFTRWLIPGVAQPPVYTFMGLLTVFVILVGPVAYRKTTRYGRGYLMFAIAPLLAMVTTLAMFGYGIVADGFGTVARVRQTTWIDGRSGDGAERVRATYFAGVRPGDGLRFPAAAEVIGYPHGTDSSWEELNTLTPATIGKVLISDDAQIFSSSFLPSRQQRQFVTHQPRPKIGILSLQSSKNLESATLKSTLGFDLDRVIARDAEGRYWVTANLRAGGTADCVSIAPRDASKELGRMYNDHRPISAVREARQRTNYRNETRDLIVNTNRAVGNALRTVTDGSFEQWLVENLQLSGEVPNQSFVAVAKVSDDVLAVEGAEVVESVRYVFGTLP